MPKVKRSDQSVRVALVLQNIKSDLGRKWSVAQMADALGVTQSQLRRLFIEATGDTPNRALINFRLEAAAERLNDPCVRVKEVLQCVGIFDASHFCREFRRRFAMSPTEYRNRRAMRSSFGSDNKCSISPNGSSD